MTLDTLIILSGSFVALLPFMGFPNSWDSFLFAIAGIFIIILGIIVRRRAAADSSRMRREMRNVEQSTNAEARHESR